MLTFIKHDLGLANYTINIFNKKLAKDISRAVRELFIFPPEKVQFQKSQVTALVAGVLGQKKKDNHSIFIPQLPDKGVKGWCISWIEGKVIPVFASARKKDGA